MAKYAQKITHFYCWTCKEYHEKTHPHYRASGNAGRRVENENKLRLKTEPKA